MDYQSSVSGGSIIDTESNVGSSSSSINTTTNNNATQFRYDDDVLEVVIIENGDDDRDGYIEILAAYRLLKPLVKMRGFTSAVLWANAINSHKLTRNSKNYIHVFALCRYLAGYDVGLPQTKTPEYHVLKRVVGDLIVGAQSSVVDPLVDIKTQLCTLNDCLSAASSLNASSSGHQQIYNGGGSGASLTSGTAELSDKLREVVRGENIVLTNNINAALDTIKMMQQDLTNKLAFSNDTMLDSFKSMKDMIIRKK